MKVNVTCFSSLHNDTTCRYDRTTSVVLGGETATARTLASQIDVNPSDIALVFRNGRRSDLDVRLAAGDRVAFAPAVGGM
jgi:molybdopterin converting factor small subunit